MLARTDYLPPGEALAAVGRLFLVSDGDALAGLWMEGQKGCFGTLSQQSVPQADTPVLEAAKQWLDRYFAQERPDPRELPLAPRGSLFQRAVWDCLLEIPYGTVTTYGAVAQKAAARLGREALSARAVGGAVGRNPISILIPCHRVIGADGSLTGYAGGLDRKRWLLRLENEDPTLF